MDIGTDDDDGLAHLLGLDGGDDARGSAAVDHDVVSLSRSETQGEQAEQGEAEEHAELKLVLAVCGWRLAVRR